jgi:hypothetical protein
VASLRELYSLSTAIAYQSFAAQGGGAVPAQ